MEYQRKLHELSILRRCPLLEDLWCSSTQVGSEGGVALFEALGGYENLKKLDLRDNMFGVEVGVKLSKALSKHEYLTEVYLSYLNMEDEGAIAIANALKDAAPLLGILEITGNDITAEAFPALEAQDQVKDIDMSVNSLRGAGARSLAQALVHNPEFKLLNVNGNFISNEGNDELKDIFKESLE
ncbi:unnamed protein product [Fraxinus pennsylvanica]|uniref:Uncharacterized protein n=1 Tax=Fraxinus pennsylvanica TaxID=56036 RepID=A0AAD2E2R4_9LAMI|nr:unnamed protein product [Fraxinus pennsylvanica]